MKKKNYSVNKIIMTEDMDMSINDSCTSFT